MKDRVSVVLLEDIENLGEAGQVVDVSEGYARNFLFEQGKAALAEAPAGRQASARKTAEENKGKEKLERAREKAENLTGTELVISAKTKEGEGEELYGSVGPARIAQELNRQAGLEVKAKDIELGRPIKAAGSYDAAVTLMEDAETTIKVTVVPEGDGFSRGSRE